MTTKNRMQIEYHDIDELTPYANNPRLNDDAVQYVANSIREFGFKVPVVMDANNIIVAGHTRIKAARKLGIREIPCIRADDLSEEQIKAFRLADNKTGEKAEWDYDALGIEMADIGMDMGQFGFDFDAEDMIDTTEVTEDDFDPEEEVNEHGVQRGQVWKLGEHRLMCGDSTSQADVKVLMEGNLAQMAFTDPPWNVDYGGADNPKWKMRKIINDNMTTDDFKDFMGAVFENMKAALEGGDCVHRHVRTGMGKSDAETQGE